MAHAFDRLKTCLDDVKKWLSTNKLKLNPDKTDFIIFGSKTQRGNSTNFSQLILVVISSLLQWQSGTLVCGLIVIFPFRGMAKISVSPVCSNP